MRKDTETSDQLTQHGFSLPIHSHIDLSLNRDREECGLECSHLHIYPTKRLVAKGQKKIHSLYWKIWCTEENCSCCSTRPLWERIFLLILFPVLQGWKSWAEELKHWCRDRQKIRGRLSEQTIYPPRWRVRAIPYWARINVCPHLLACPGVRGRKRAQDWGRAGKPVPLSVLATFQQGKSALLHTFLFLRDYWSWLGEREGCLDIVLIICNALQWGRNGDKK